MLREMKAGYVYIMASGRNGTLYIGVTSDLVKRAWEHRKGVIGGFTDKYRCKLLVWYAAYDHLQQARLRELQMKKWKRIWKLSEIEQINPDWKGFLSDAAVKAPAEPVWTPAFAGARRPPHSSSPGRFDPAGAPCFGSRRIQST